MLRRCRLRQACGASNPEPNQYSAVSKSSTTQALIHIVHHWSRETNDNGATVIVTLFYYQKAFDLIDHKILVSKLCKLSIPTTIIDWITDFFSDRFQRIKLSEGCYSECGSVPSGIAEVMGSNPVESPEFFRFMRQLLKLSSKCEDYIFI